MESFHGITESETVTNCKPVKSVKKIKIKKITAKALHL